VRRDSMRWDARMDLDDGVVLTGREAVEMFCRLLAAGWTVEIGYPQEVVELDPDAS